MTPKIKLKRKSAPISHTPKTKDDFVRWLKEKHAQTAEKQMAKTSRDTSQALMVWADDGGAFVKSQPLIKTIEQSLGIKEKKS